MHSRPTVQFVFMHSRRLKLYMYTVIITWYSSTVLKIIWDYMDLYDKNIFDRGLYHGIWFLESNKRIIFSANLRGAKIWLVEVAHTRGIHKLSFPWYLCTVNRGICDLEIVVLVPWKPWYLCLGKLWYLCPGNRGTRTAAYPQLQYWVHYSSETRCLCLDPGLLCFYNSYINR